MRFKEFLVQEGLGGGVSGLVRTQIANLHDKGKFSRKPISWDDVKDSIKAKDYKQLIKALGVINPKDLYGKSNPKLTDQFDIPTPQAFIVAIPGRGRFLIDTAGYDYARYVTRIVE